jgi:phosphoserine phosphatase
MSSSESVNADVHGLVVFDLDGTLLRGPTVCEVLAESLGHIEEMRRFERLSGEREIITARGEMARWYKDLSIDDLQALLENLNWAPAHSRLFNFWVLGRLKLVSLLSRGPLPWNGAPGG